MGYYKDLREHVNVLEANDKLVRIKKEINKDTELMPLVRWQFRGLPEEERKAFLFENVFDAKGRKYDIPVLVASHAASRQVYAIGMKCRPEEIMEKWAEALLHPIEPKLVETGPVQEEVHTGDKLLEHGGLDEFPIPISTPGFDNAPYLSAANWVSKDPDTGGRNIGNYRAMIKSRTRTGICLAGPHQHLLMHWEKYKSRGIPLPVAIVLGASPNIGYMATVKIAYGTDEYAVAGGVAGEPVELVKCKTVDIDVPATAEIVIEGEIPTDYMEREGPFGEFTGYMGIGMTNPYFNVTAITHRKNPIYNAFISQFPPSESSKLRQMGQTASYYQFLKYQANVPEVLDLALHESCGASMYCVIKLGKAPQSQVWQSLNAAVAFRASSPKIFVAVDDDIDAWDPDAVNWAIAFRIQPHRDIRIIEGRAAALDYSTAPPTAHEKERQYPSPGGASALLINATRKWDYPPVSLPKKQFMERAREIWAELELPKLTPKVPWYGYSLGYWTEELEEEAGLAVKGDYYLTGEKLAQERIKA
jgi:4-hydroxy-3-polyprenylbenzoate decarboxylase